MSDIKVTLNGDASGAVSAILDANEAMRKMAEENAKAAEKTHQLVEALKRGAEAVYEFGKKSLEAFEAQEKADRQLQRVAGELTETFKAQATAMQEHLGVSDDMVEGIQTMLLRFGEAPADVQATTKAILDYSAATGEDAVAATHALLAGVQSGKTVFKDLGLEYEKTGTASKDLANVTGALASKLGGAADAEADTLGGSVRKAKEAVGEFQESLGGLVSEFIVKTGAVGTFTQAIKDLQLALFGAPEDSLVHLQQNLDAAQEKLKGMQAKLADAGRSLISKSVVDDLKKEIDDQIAEVKRLDDAFASMAKKKRDAALSGEAPLSTHGSDRKTGNGKVKEEREEKRTFTEEQDDEDLNLELKNNAAKIEAEQKYWNDVLKVQQDGQKATMAADDAKKKHDDDVMMKEAEAYEAEEKKLSDHLKKMADEAQRENKKFEQEMSAMGTRIGQAMTSTLVAALQAAIDGTEFDVLGAVADLGFGVAAIVGSVIANIYEPGSGAAVGTIISSIGGLASAERKRAWSAEQKAKAATKHDGGWIESFHSGGWPGLGSDEQPIVAQRGERMLSRSEVGRMGGPGGVDAAARGGGGTTHITVQAFDSQSITEMFQGRMGRSFTDAIRTGRGDLNALFP